MNATESSIAERVEAGIAALKPAHRKLINTRTLDMGDFANCVAGQLAKHDINFFTDYADCSAAKEIELGVDLPHDEATPEGYAELTAEWKAAL